MKLASVTCDGRGETDAFLAQVVAGLESRQVPVAGTVQCNTQRPGRRRCDMDLRVLPDGPVVRISEDRGDLARGCRLDSGALEQTVAEVMARLPAARILIVNKFGKRECEGRGLVPAIAAALEAGLPVLVGVNGQNRAAFEMFCAGMSVTLPAEERAVLQWCLDASRAGAD